MKKNFHVTYATKAHPTGITRAAIPDGQGACDAIVVMSIARSEAGESTHIMSLDGETIQPLPDVELFKQWALLAHRLSQSTSLDLKARRLAAHVHETVSADIAKSREAAKPPAKKTS